MTDSQTFAIVAPIAVAVTIAPPPTASVQVGATTPVSATLVNDTTANPSVTWSVSCAATPCGTLNPTTTVSEAPTQFTAPTTIPSGTIVTLTATSVTDPTKSATVKIAITAATPTLANGTYVFQTAGSPGSASSFVTGVFVASNGSITGGEQDSLSFTTDFNNNTVGDTEFVAIVGGSYATLPDGNLQVSLNTQDGGVETLIGTTAGNGAGFVGGILGAPNEVTLELQSSLVAPSAGYAISLFGGDPQGGPLWLAGVVNVDGAGSISGAGSRLDVVDGVGELTGSYSLGLGSVSAPDAYGRVLVQVTPQGSGSLQPLSLAMYDVDTAHSRLIETGDLSNDSTFDGVFAGVALSQGASTGGFTATAVAGTTYVVGAAGQDTVGPLQIAGLFTLNADGSVTGTLNWNDLSASVAQSPLPFTGTYTLDSTGRLTLNHLTDNATFNYSLAVYLAGDGGAVVVSQDASSSFTGQAFRQQSTPFAAAALPVTVGLNATVWSPDADAGGAAQSSVALGSLALQTTAATTSVSGFADAGYGNGLGVGSDFAVSGAMTVAADGIGTGTLAGLDPRSRTTTGAVTGYFIDANHAVLLESDAGQAALAYWGSM